MFGSRLLYTHDLLYLIFFLRLRLPCGSRLERSRRTRVKMAYENPVSSESELEWDASDFRMDRVTIRQTGQK